MRSLSTGSTEAEYTGIVLALKGQDLITKKPTMGTNGPLTLVIF
jgi:hypothetical protein